MSRLGKLSERIKKFKTE